MTTMSKKKKGADDLDLQQEGSWSNEEDHLHFAVMKQFVDAERDKDVKREDVLTFLQMHMKAEVKKFNNLYPKLKPLGQRSRPQLRARFQDFWLGKHLLKFIPEVCFKLIIIYSI